MSQDKKYQVFISSTYEDLKEERKYAIDAVLKLRQIPAGMELFSASNNTPWEEIENEINESDYYVIIVAYKYGSIDPASKLSFTQKEYEYAVKSGKQILAFIIDDKNAKWEDSKRDKSAGAIKKLNDFKDIIKTNKLVLLWKDKEDLQTKVLTTLSLQIARNPQRGWVKSSEGVDHVSKELARLSEENHFLKDKLLKSENSEDKNIEDIVNDLKTKQLEYTFNYKTQSSVNFKKILFKTNLLELFYSFHFAADNQGGNIIGAQVPFLMNRKAMMRRIPKIIPTDIVFEDKRLFIKNLKDVFETYDLILIEKEEIATFWTISEFGKKIIKRAYNDVYSKKGVIKLD